MYYAFLLRRAHNDDQIITFGAPEVNTSLIGN